MFGKAVLCAALALVAPIDSWAQETSQGEGDPYVLAVMNDFNRTLRAEWMDLRVQVEQVELLAVDQERMGGSIHSLPFRWVEGDPRRAAQGNDLTYRVDGSEGFGSNDVPPGTAEEAIDRAMASWGSDSCLQRLSVVKRQDGVPVDADIFDSQFGYGAFGDYRAADVVHAGWLPASFFESVTGPGGGESVVAISVTFIYTDLEGVPSDIDGDGYMDAAHSEIYYNQGFAWTHGAGDGTIDVETVALHEVGHALGLGHFAPPPVAVMNPAYTGQRRQVRPTDHAGLCSIWSSWGNGGNAIRSR